MPHCLHSVGSVNKVCLWCDVGYYWDDGSKSCLKCQIDGCLHCRDASSCLTCEATPSGSVALDDCFYESCYKLPLVSGQFYSPRCDWCGAVQSPPSSCGCTTYQAYDNNAKTCFCSVTNCKLNMLYFFR